MKRAINNFMKYIYLISALFLCILISGCFSKAPQPTLLSSVRPQPSNIITKTVIVSRPALEQALQKEGSSFRLIKVFRREAPTGLPEYRVFGIQRSSSYELIGLQNADILIAANDYIIYNPQGFSDFMKFLAKNDGGQVEVLRGQQPILLDCKVVG